MSNMAFTRIKDDVTKLGLWLYYYSKYFDDLFVVGHQTGDNFFDDLHTKYKFEHVYNPDHIHSMESLYLIKELQQRFLKDHEWVLYTDADEFVIADPKQYKDLKDFMNKTDKQQTFCEGYDIYRDDDENPILYDQPILAQRRNWYRDHSGSYNKPALSRVPTNWVHGFHYIEGMQEAEIKAIENTGLYMVHLKHIEGAAGSAPTSGSPIPKEIKKFL